MRATKGKATTVNTIETAKGWFYITHERFEEALSIPVENSPLYRSKIPHP